MATTHERLTELAAARDEYTAKLTRAQALEGAALAAAVTELRALARNANDRLGAFSRDMGLGSAIETESLRMLELAKEGTNDDPETGTGKARRPG